MIAARVLAGYLRVVNALCAGHLKNQFGGLDGCLPVLGLGIQSM